MRPTTRARTSQADAVALLGQPNFVTHNIHSMTSRPCHQQRPIRQEFWLVTVFKRTTDQPSLVVIGIKEFSMNKSASMGRMPFISIRSGQDVKFHRQIKLLLHFGDFEAAFAAVRRRPHWENDSESLLQLGIILHRFAPRSRDRAYAYSCARRLYRRAAAFASDIALRADALASIGTAYLEEGRFEEATFAYMTSLMVDPANRFAILGQLSVSCARRDLGEIRRTCDELTSRMPTWHTDRDVVAMLATDPDYAFLRASAVLFLECFGGYPADMQALHEMHRLVTLAEKVDEKSNEESLYWEEPAVRVGTGASECPTSPSDSFDDLMEGCTWNGPLPSSLTARSRLGLRV